MIFYVIRNTDDDQLFWSNRLGWVETDQEERFTLEQRQTLSLPIGGLWVACHPDNQN